MRSDHAFLSEGRSIDEAPVIRVSARAPSHFGYAAALPQGVLDRGSKRVRDKSERVEEIALACSVGTDQKSQWPKFHVAGCDTLIVPQKDTRYEGRAHRFARLLPKL